MALPLVPIGLGLAATAALGYALFAKPAPKAGTPGQPGQLPPAPPPQPPTPGAPPELTALVNQLLANGRDPVAMEEAASRIEAYGMVKEAAQLRARAAELRRLGSGPIPVPPSPIPVPPSPIPVPTAQTALVTGQPGANTRVAPSTSAALVSANDAFFGKTVTVINWNAGSADGYDWAQIRTPGGSIGFAAKKFLQLGASPIPLPPSPTPVAIQTATATGQPGTNVRTSMSTSAPLVAANDAWYGKTVVVLNWNAGSGGGYEWAQVRTPGGSVGYAAKNFLSLNAPAPIAAGDMPTIKVGSNGGTPKLARCVAPSGCRLRRAPRPESPAIDIVPSGALLHVRSAVRLPKSDRGSPGPGGWAHVSYQGQDGWVPSEWIKLQ